MALHRSRTDAISPVPRPSRPVQQAAFLAGATSMLRTLPYVQRYAWFALPATPADGSAGLFDAGGAATEVGRAYEAAGRS